MWSASLLSYKYCCRLRSGLSIMASPPAWTNSAGILSIPADFPSFSVLIAASTFSRIIG